MRKITIGFGKTFYQKEIKNTEPKSFDLGDNTVSIGSKEQICSDCKTPLGEWRGLSPCCRAIIVNS